jgi:hypothetical protein
MEESTLFREPFLVEFVYWAKADGMQSGLDLADGD